MKRLAMMLLMSMSLLPHIAFSELKAPKNVSKDKSVIEKESQNAENASPLDSASVMPKEIKRILSLTVDSSINPGVHNYLQTGYQKAQAEAFDAILIKLDTPGGLVTTTKDILTLIGSSPLLTIIWITPEGASASSAGAIIASGAHILAMSEGTNMGAATPIQLGKDIEQSDARRKAINDLVALVQSLSESRGRNPELFGKMIEEAASYKSKEAKEHNLIDFIASTDASLYKQLSGKKVSVLGQAYELKADTPQITAYEMDLGQKLLNILASPNLAYILFLVGAALLYVEFQAPGGMIAGVMGALCLILAGIGFQVLPLNFGALILMVLAFIMFVLEAYITSYGLLSIGGLAALLAGSLFLFRTDDAYISMSRSLIFATVSVISLFILAIGYFVFRDLKKNKTPQNYYSLKGKTATIVAVLPQDGSEHFYQIKIAGEIWKARSDELYKVGETCIIKEENVNGLVLKI